MVSAESTLVRKHVKLKCYTVSGLRLNGESNRDHRRVSGCAYEMRAHTGALCALTPHSATALKRLPESKQGELTT